MTGKFPFYYGIFEYGRETLGNDRSKKWLDLNELDQPVMIPIIQQVVKSVTVCGRIVRPIVFMLRINGQRVVVRIMGIEMVVVGQQGMRAQHQQDCCDKQEPYFMTWAHHWAGMFICFICKLDHLFFATTQTP